MNVAILYDTEENAEISAKELLAGEPLYGHSLKQFYFHPNIDGIIVMGQYKELEEQIKDDTRRWGGKEGTGKSVKVLQKSAELREAIEMSGEIWKIQAASYVFHDIRYPLVTEDMIYLVEQGATAYGLAVMASGIANENIVLVSEREQLPCESFCYVKYPIAIKANHLLLREIHRTNQVLNQMVKYGAYLCKTRRKNLPLYSKEDKEIIEAFILANKKFAVKDSYAYSKEYNMQ